MLPVGQPMRGYFGEATAMANQYSFIDLAKEVLGQSDVALAPDEIWQKATALGLVTKLQTKGATPWQSLGASLYTVKPEKGVIRLEGTPAKFGLAGKHEGQFASKTHTSPTVEPASTQPKIKHERDLHPFLAYFAKGVMGEMAVKTIYHEKSKKLPFGEWLHPDVVGFRLLSKDWASGAREIAQACGGSITRLYSFELKRQLNQQSLRESFFQCVSNSSWANEAWLVAEKLEESIEFDKELKRLSAWFGIGVIQLNVDAPESCEIRLPARYRDEIDWETVSKLADHNPDFQQFLGNVRLAVHAGNFVNLSQFDAPSLPE
jgi:hypothetical protein